MGRNFIDYLETVWSFENIYILINYYYYYNFGNMVTMSLIIM